MGQSTIRRTTAAAILTGCFAAAWAQSITSVDPTTATIGTQIAITGEGFGEAKAKVSIVPRADMKRGPKQFSLAVLTSSDTQILAEVKKAAEGTFDVVVQPKGGEPITAAMTLDIVRPVLADVEPAAPLRNTEVTLTGTFFGTKKPKVAIGGKKAKVLEFSDTSITARVHKKTPLGSQTVVVTNKIGPNTVPVMVDVQEEPDGTSPTNRLQATAPPPERFKLAALGDAVTVARSGSGFRIEADGRSGEHMVLDFSNVDLATLAPPVTVAPDLVEFTGGGSTWRAVGSFDVQIRRRTGNTIEADFRDSLPRVSGTGSAELDLDGSFVATVP